MLDHAPSVSQIPMIHRFGRFTLDEGRRTLRVGPTTLELQPRVFDLLVYLVRNHDRVVPKEELLSAIWPGVIVTDSSVMRAVSLIRTMLRDGGLPDGIETFSRRGYRFTASLAEAKAPVTQDRNLAKARSASGRGEWQQALKAYACATRSREMSAQDFEQWAHAAMYVGQPHEAVRPLEHAVAAHIENADRIGAARAALSLTNVQLEARAVAVAKGWHRRAAAFLADERKETREHGLHLWLTARIAMFEGDLPRALEQAKEAEALARRIEDPDVEALGLVYRGHVELATGEIRAALVHLDEAGAATLAGTLSAWVSGFVFCSVIWAYFDRGDVIRAGQWTDQFTRWTRRNAGFGAPGLCRLHRGEVLCIQGKLEAAESEIHRARELLSETALYAEGDAWRVLGEIRLLRGDHAGAEDSFRRAHELGWNPLPGWAILRAENGQTAEAIKSLERALRSPSWADGQRRGILLAQLARIAARCGKHSLAKRSLLEPKASPELRATAGCEAMYHQARAELALAANEHEEAIAALRSAIEVWREVGSRINVAHVRLRLAEVLAASGDATEARLELSAAEKAFADMDAAPMVGRCERVRQTWS